MKILRYILILIFVLFSSCASKYSNSNDELSMVEESVEDVRLEEMIVESPIYDDIEIEKDESKPPKDLMKNINRSINSDNQTGTLTYRIDSLFIIDVTSRVEARITKKLYDGEPTEMIELFSQSSSGDIMIKRIVVGEVMDIELKTLDVDAFIINKISSSNQIVNHNNITEWIWGVTPKKIGNFNLILKVTIKLESGVNIDQTVFDKIINVENKPKRNFNIYIEKPDYLKYKKTDKINLVLSKTISDSTDFQWGGNGKLNIKLSNSNDFDIFISDNIIDDNKNLFVYNWNITPKTNKKQTINFNIQIIGDNEILTIYNGDIFVKPDWGKRVNEFIDITIKRWYFVFSSLLIPLFIWIRKKYFIKKK